MGDYNEILLPYEVRGGSFNSNRARKLAAVMDSCGLMDLGSTGLFFTWTRTAIGEPPISKWLDRALADCNWRTQFPEAYVEVLFRHHSDHSPLLLRCKGDVPDREKRPFPFQAAWLTHEDFPRVVQKAWQQGNHIIPHSLSRVQKDAQEFNSKTFGNIFKRKRSLEARMTGIQRTWQNSDILNLAMLERELHKEYSEVLKQKELLWYQKFREKWVKLGDRNTKFFHTQTIVRRRRNKIQGMFIENDSWCTDSDTLKGEARKFFSKTLFCWLLC